MNFVRHMAGLKEECKLGPREQFNEISSYIDGGTIYSSNPEKQEKLRLHKGGLLKSLPVFKDLNMKDLMPLNLEEPDEGCLRPHKDVFCFLADPDHDAHTVHERAQQDGQDNCRDQPSLER